MKRWIIWIFLGVCLLSIGEHSHAQSTNSWSQIIPRVGFGYGGLSTVYWSPLNGQLGVASESGLQFYNADMHLEAERRFASSTPSSVLFSPDMAYVALYEANGLIIRDTQAWEPILALGQFRAPSWSPDSQFLAVWAGSTLRIWNVAEAEVTLEISELISENVAVQWSPDSQVVAVPGRGAIVMVSAGTGDIIRIHPFETVRDFHWSIDGRWLAVIGLKDPLPLDRDPDDPVLYDLMLVDALSGEIVTYYDTSSGGILGSRYGADQFVSISPDGRYIAAQLTRWEPTIGRDDIGNYPDDAVVTTLTPVEEQALSSLLDETFVLATEQGDTTFWYALIEAWWLGIEAGIYNTLYVQTENIRDALELGDIELAHHFINIILSESEIEQLNSPPQQLPNRAQNARWVSPGMGVWDLETGATLHNFADLGRPLANVRFITWSPDSNRFATAQDMTLTIFEANRGGVVDSLRAYISSTSRLEWSGDGNGLIVANGLWDVTGEQPIYQRYVPSPSNPRPIDLSFLQPNPYVFDYSRPPYRWEVKQVYEDRGLVITYEQDIEYPGTPEYEDDIPPDERWIIWDIATQERWEEYSNLGKQTAWLYDLDNAHERDGGNTYFNVKRTTRFVVIGDDEIVDLRTEEKTWLEVNRWEWREVWFGPNGDRIYAYDTDNRLKAFDPLTGELLYETVPAPRNAMVFTDDYSRFTLIDRTNTVYVYDAPTGDLLLEAYTGNQRPDLLWSDDLSRLAIGGDNNAIIIYDISSQTRLTVLRGHRGPITAMAWHSTCDYSNIAACKYVMASSDVDGRVLLWGVAETEDDIPGIPDAPAAPEFVLPEAEIDFGGLEPLWTYVAEGETFGRSSAYRVRWAANGIRINSNYFYDTELNLLDDFPGGDDWDMPTEQHPDGLTVSEDGMVINREGDVVWVGRDTVYDVAFSVDGTRVFTAEVAEGRNTLTGRIRVWSSRSGLQADHFGGGAPGYNQVELSPDGRWLATTTLDFFGSGGRGQLWSTVDFTLHHSLIGHTADIIDLRWHPSSGAILTASHDGSVRLWNTSGDEVARWRHLNAAPIEQVMWGTTPDTLIVSAGNDLYVLDTYLLTELRRFAAVGGRDFDWSPDHTQLVSIGRDSVVRVIDYATGDILAEERRHMPSITSLEWHPDGEILAVGRRDGSVVILDGSDGTLREIVRPYGLPIRAMHWRPDGTRLLLDLEDGPIEIMDVTSDGDTIQIENIWRRSGVWWSPDGSQIAFGTYPDPEMGVYTATSLVWVYDTATGQPTFQFPLEWYDYSWYWDVKPFALSWSPESHYLAAFYGGNLRYWDLAQGVSLGTYPDIGRELGMSLWQDGVLYLWMTDGHGSLIASNGAFDYIERDGLPAGTRLRPDGQVILAGDYILDFATFYPLQEVPRYIDAAAWHPNCWAADCSAVLAVAGGSEVIMLGYPQEDE